MPVSNSVVEAAVFKNLKNYYGSKVCSQNRWTPNQFQSVLIYFFITGIYKSVDDVSFKSEILISWVLLIASFALTDTRLTK